MLHVLLGDLDSLLKLCLQSEDLLPELVQLLHVFLEYLALVFLERGGELLPHLEAESLPLLGEVLVVTVLLFLELQLQVALVLGFHFF